jgi:beta-phosphoglucomutase-like phosphatase (HAD superfamily)
MVEQRELYPFHIAARGRNLCALNREKPSPDVFVAAAKRLRVAIEDCIIVGDSVWDLLAAAARALSAWVFCPEAPDRRNSKARAHSEFTLTPPTCFCTLNS